MEGAGKVFARYYCAALVGPARRFGRGLFWLPIGALWAAAAATLNGFARVALVAGLIAEFGPLRSVCPRLVEPGIKSKGVDACTINCEVHSVRAVYPFMICVDYCALLNAGLIS